MRGKKFSQPGFTILLVLLFVVGLIVAGVLYVRKDIGIASEVKTTATTKQSSLSPTPRQFPFSEMTIPYLRDREYVSMLGTLKEYQTYETYTSYITSYESDSLRVNGLLTIPKGEKPQKGWPAIVFVHGYIPPSLYKTTEKYVEYVDYLSRNGFVVFKIDLRGHGNSEGEPGGGYYSSDYIIDTLNAYAALQSTDYVNKDAIGVWGHSMAGNVVSRVWAAKPTIPAVVIWSGAGYTYKDLQDYRLNDNSYRPPNENTGPRRRREELFKAHGQFDPNSEFWKQVPSTNYLNDLKGAIEIHHAVDDTVVSVEYSRNLMKLLDTTDVPHQLYEYSSGGHNISGASFTKAMERTVEFYKKILGG